jgi:hypothetical protein
VNGGARTAPPIPIHVVSILRVVDVMGRSETARTFAQARVRRGTKRMRWARTIVGARIEGHLRSWLPRLVLPFVSVEKLGLFRTKQAPRASETLRGSTFSQRPFGDQPWHIRPT